MTTFEHENDRKSIVGGPAICPEETFSENMTEDFSPKALVVVGRL